MSEAITVQGLPKGELLKGKKGLIMGVANNKSLAWGISHASYLQGAELAFSYQGEALEKRISPLAESVSSDTLIACDVSDMSSVDAAFKFIKEKWGKLDFLVHSIAYSNKDELKGRYVDTSLENFLHTMNISCYSFIATAKRAAELMKDGGSIVTLTYYGAEKVIPNYNVMGVAKAALEASVKYIAADLGEKNIRVNAISSGPVKTLAASGIGDFRSFLKWSEDNTPLKRNTTLEDVGGTAVYLLSDLSSGVTGEVIHVDSGYHVMGMKMLSSENNSEE
ncbi:SDR family oxidoreductase [Holosporaceae bacterium 'Namur']|nr:SDR family oxidoreductase [Holosporaceae bacterium 'Namur']